MINVADLPCLREHFERVAATEQEAAKSKEPQVQYARAPDGPGYQPSGRPVVMQRNNR
jgi:hypothetical protein